MNDTLPADFTVTIPNGETSNTGSFVLAVEDDDLFDPGETLQITATPRNVPLVLPTTPYTFSPGPLTITIDDNETLPTMIDLSLSTDSISEDADPTTVTVTAAFSRAYMEGDRLDVSDPAIDVDIMFTVSNDTAQAEDFTDPGSVTVTIDEGETSGTGSFVLTVADDDGFDPGETLLITPFATEIPLMVGTNYTFDPAALTITITDDGAPPTLVPSLSTTSVDEGVGTVTVTVTAALSGTISEIPPAAVVMFTVAGDTAAAGEDFMAPGTVSLCIGDAAAISALTDSSSCGTSTSTTGTGTFELMVVDDSESEDEETLVVTATTVTLDGAVDLSSTTAVTITITDNDARPVVEALLPELGRIYAASVIDAVSGRVEAVASGDLPRFADHSSLAHALAANQQSLNDGDLSSLLEGGGSSLAFELGGAGAAGWSGGGQAPLSSQPGFWASADYDHVSSKADGLGDWQGRQYSLHAGVDGKISRNARVGLAVSWAPSSFTFDDDERLDTDASLRGLNPYFGWHSEDGRTVLWTLAGFGTGDFEVDGQDIDTNLQTTMVAAGGSNHLAEESGYHLHLKADISTIRIRSGTASDTVPAMQVRAHRARVALEAEAEHIYDSGASLTRSVEAGVRIDGGDGDTGSGVEIEGAVDWSNPGTGVTMTGGAHLLFLHSGNLERSLGVSGLIHYAPPSAQGRGLTLQARPSYGGTGSGAGRLWEREATNLESEDDADPKARLVLDAGWGLPALSGRQLVTPYSSLELSEDGSRVWRLGSRATIDSAFSIDLVGDRTERGDSLEHGVGLQLRMQW